MIKTQDLIEKLNKSGFKIISEETVVALCKPEPEPEPEPEHWNYGLDKNGRPAMSVRIDGAMQDCSDVQAYTDGTGGVTHGHVHAKMGNLGEDLKLWATDCEESEKFGKNSTNVTIEPDGQLYVDSGFFIADEAIKFFKAGLQVAYTALRKKEQK